MSTHLPTQQSMTTPLTVRTDTATRQKLKILCRPGRLPATDRGLKLSTRKTAKTQWLSVSPVLTLAQVLKNKMVPEIDTYILSTIAAAGAVADRDDIVADAATSSSNAYTNFLTINADITDREAPTEGRVAGMTSTYYNLLKQGGFVLDSDSAYRDRKSGNLGSVDGVDVVIIPSGRMPSTSGVVDLLITHPMATVAPEKLTDYTLQKNPQGISGDVLEYRHRYDAFVTPTKLVVSEYTQQARTYRKDF
jgi:hypothetical protein